MIPHIIHQTWKTDDIPELPRFPNLADRTLIGPTGSGAIVICLIRRNHYPACLELFCSYRRDPAADAGRYMPSSFWGIYADMIRMHPVAGSLASEDGDSLRGAGTHGSERQVMWAAGMLLTE